MSESIGIRPGVYTTRGQKEVMGLCVVIDDTEAGWELMENTDGSMTIHIPNRSPWRAMRGSDNDDKKGSYYLQIFRVGGKLNSIELQSFVNSTGDVHTPNASHPADKEPGLKIHYTSPEAISAYPVAEQQVEPAKMT